MTRRLRFLLVVAVLGLVPAATPGLVPAGATDTSAPGDTEPFERLGAWVDVYDYAPAFQSDGAVPAVTPASVRDMAGLGVETLYLQAAQLDDRSKGDLVDRRLIGRFLREAHDHDVRVVAWFLPKFDKPSADLRRIRAMVDFEVDDQRFDGFGLDIEWTGSVTDVAARNDALIELSRKARNIVGDAPLGAIVLDPVLLEVVNDQYWPSFPWRKIRNRYDAWLPMTYWTNRDSESGYREGFAYADENIRRLRANLGRSDAAVHPIGGIADDVSPADVNGFVRAARRNDAIGWSLYDYATTPTPLWTRLRP
ncbi:MAG TPA: hypothetical protein VFF40_02405 [Acidimicrobiia bacterium]|nr:hypothetical protein [Acidimicrobiia bacterium]